MGATVTGQQRHGKKGGINAPASLALQPPTSASPMVNSRQNPTGTVTALCRSASQGTEQDGDKLILYLSCEQMGGKKANYIAAHWTL